MVFLKVRWAVFVAVLVAVFIVSCRTVPEPLAETVPGQVHFSDVADSAGLDFQHGAFRWEVSGDPSAMLGGGLCWLDYDRDGWLDLYAVNSYAEAEAGKWEAAGGLPRSALYRNDHGRFANVSASTGTDLQIPGNGCLAADFDLDGWTDLYITTSQENVLLWNNGGALFSPGGAAAGVDAAGWHSSAVAGDVNRDGWPDIFIAGYAGIDNQIPGATAEFPDDYIGRRDLLYLNQGLDNFGRATFREVGDEAGLEDGKFAYGLGALFSDLDGDGDLDLVVANHSSPNQLYENVAWPGGAAADPAGLGFRLVEVGQYANVSYAGGVGITGGDYNGDGRFDLVTTGFEQQPHSLYANRSTGDGIIFQETSRDMGLKDVAAGWSGWGVSWADTDLDTDLDLIVANGAFPVTNPPADAQPIQYFANLTAQGMTGLLQDLTNFAGFTSVEPSIARGSAVADYDNDGDLDLAVNAVGGRLVLLRNDGVTGHWLAVGLDGSQPGAVAAVTAGAVVTAVLPGGRQLVCETHAGGGYLSSEDPRCHFGLGQSGTVEVLHVRWPDGSESRLEDLPAGTLVTVHKEEAITNTPAITAEPVDSPAEIEAFLFTLALKRGGARLPEVLPAASPEMIRLGEVLFWDRELSGNRDMACVTCHHPLAGTGDALSLSIGVGGSGFAASRSLGQGRALIPRNAPEIYNRGADGWHTMFWDGRVSGLAGTGFISPAGVGLPLGLDNIVAVQAMFPVTSRDEMRGRIGDLDVFGRLNELAVVDDSSLKAIWAAIMDRLLAIPEYRSLFAAAYPNVPVGRLGFQHAANAIAAYEMSAFTHLDSPWDRYLAGDGSALSPEARRGARLFYGQAGCSRCHNGSLLTDQRYHNVAVPQIGPGKGDEAPHDYGRGRETGMESDMFAFRTPPLRNVALTGPWLHNGAYTTLEAAVRHMLDPLSGLAHYDLSQLDPVLAATYEERPELLQTLDPLLEEPVDLSPGQVDDLLAFLLALTSPTALDGCWLIPNSVPSGLPVDEPPPGLCD